MNTQTDGGLEQRVTREPAADAKRVSWIELFGARRDDSGTWRRRDAETVSICPACKFLYYNSNNSIATQQSQVESALTQGAKVISFTPVDVNACTAVM
jgi:hypothetical protein